MPAEAREAWEDAGFSLATAAYVYGREVAYALPLPAWVDDDDDALRRIDRKAVDDLGGDVWRDVLRLIRVCTAVVRRHTAGAASLPEVVFATDDALRVARALAASLPPPPPQSVVWPPRLRGDLRDEPVSSGTVAAMSELLAVEVAAASWTCPSVLSGAVDDTRRALRAFRRDLLRPRSAGCR